MLTRLELNEIEKLLRVKSSESLFLSTYPYLGPCTRSATDDIPIHLEENWEIGNRGGSGKMIRPRREDILKLKQVLKEKYPNVEKTGGFEATGGLFADTDSMYSTDGPSRYQ